MENFEIGDLNDLTRYARVRVFISGLFRTILGLVTALIPAVLIGAVLSGDIGPQKPGDLPHWALLLVGAVLSVVVVAIFIGGIVRMISAFAGGCYFRAGRDGLAIRFPRQRWFGRYTIPIYRYKWSEIEQIVHYRQTVNFIPITTSLHIYPRGGKRIEVDRMYFSKSTRQLQKELLALQAESWK